MFSPWPLVYQMHNVFLPVNPSRLCSIVDSTSDSRARGSEFNTQSGYLISFSFHLPKKVNCQLQPKICALKSITAQE